MGTEIETVASIWRENIYGLLTNLEWMHEKPLEANSKTFFKLPKFIKSACM